MNKNIKSEKNSFYFQNSILFFPQNDKKNQKQILNELEDIISVFHEYTYDKNVIELPYPKNLKCINDVQGEVSKIKHLIGHQPKHVIIQYILDPKNGLKSYSNGEQIASKLEKYCNKLYQSLLKEIVSEKEKETVFLNNISPKSF